MISMFVSIDYREDGPSVGEAYFGIKLEIDEDKVERFATGDPVADLAAARKRANEIATEGNGNAVLMESSSLTHFVFDIPGYRFTEKDALVVDEEELALSRTEDFDYDAWRNGDYAAS